MWREELSSEFWSQGRGKEIQVLHVGMGNGRERVLGSWMCKSAALGLGRVKLGGRKLYALTNRSPGLRSESKSSGRKLQGLVED